MRSIAIGAGHRTSLNGKEHPDTLTAMGQPGQNAQNRKGFGKNRADCRHFLVSSGINRCEGFARPFSRIIIGFSCFETFRDVG